MSKENKLAFTPELCTFLCRSVSIAKEREIFLRGNLSYNSSFAYTHKPEWTTDLAYLVRLKLDWKETYWLGGGGNFRSDLNETSAPFHTHETVNGLLLALNDAYPQFKIDGTNYTNFILKNGKKDLRIAHRVGVYNPEWDNR